MLTIFNHFSVQPNYDIHLHTEYSDGRDWKKMTEAAMNMGLENIGFTDHCILWEDDFGRFDWFNFYETYTDRRKELNSCAKDISTNIFDGVEMTYDPNYEQEISEFLEKASFDYTIGSVHYAGNHSINAPDDLEGSTQATKRDAVNTYVDWQCQLIETDLFDVVGHIDLPQRSPILRGIMDESDYRRIADALKTSKTLPELNLHRIDSNYSKPHPNPDYHDIFVDNNISFLIGTDSHTPDQIGNRHGSANYGNLEIDLLNTPPWTN